LIDAQATKAQGHDYEKILLKVHGSGVSGGGFYRRRGALDAGAFDKVQDTQTADKLLEQLYARCS
jgi:hypothetical protein